VAMKLEANRLQLPGVVLDDNTLVRRYPGGPSMSHILGYVGIIADQDGVDHLVRMMHHLVQDQVGHQALEVNAASAMRRPYGDNSSRTRPLVSIANVIVISPPMTATAAKATNTY